MQKLVNTLEQVDKRNSSSRKLNHLQKPSIHDPGIEDIANGDGVLTLALALIIMCM
jgi:hypothetical protein